MYREVIALDPSHAGAEYALGVALSRKGDPAGARAALEKSAVLAPGNPLPALELARSFAASGELTEAEKFAREALKIQPGLVPARLTLAGALEASGRTDAALAEYRALAAGHPELAAAHFHVGALLHRQGDLNGAAGAYRRALKADANFAPALNNLAAITLERDKKPAEAEKLARMAVAAAPQGAPYHDTLAGILKARGDLAGAVKEQEAAALLAPQSPEYLARAGELRARLGNREQAIDALTRALAISRSFPGATEAEALLKDLKQKAR
jgi:tetratricopeptide (TPR) repeat protein